MTPNPTGKLGLFELIVVVTLIGVLAAAGVKYYGQVMDEARRAAFESQARAFTALVAMLHWSWSVRGEQFVPAASQGVDAVRLDGRLIYMNANGWPVHAGQAQQGAAISAAGCSQLWDALMMNPGVVWGQGEMVPDNRWRVRLVNNSKCRFETLTAGQAYHYFDYDALNGRIEVQTGLARP